MTISMKKIAERRIELGMTVSEFARLVGISRKTYYDWEKGAAPVLDKYAKVLTEVLQLDIEELRDEDKVEKPEATVQGLFFDMDEIKKRTQWAINHIITRHDLSNVKLARVLCLSTSTIDSYRRGLKTPKLEVLAFIQDTYKISLDWIVDGRGSQFTSDRLTEPFPGIRVQNGEYDAHNTPDVLLANEFVFIPQMAGTISNGSLSPDGASEMRIAFRRDWVARKGLAKDMSIIKVQGDSMEPTLLSGDLVLVDHSKDATTRGGLFAITIDQDILIKRIQPLMTTKLLVISDNSKYTTLEIDADDIKINGKIIWFARELER